MAYRVIAGMGWFAKMTYKGMKLGMGLLYNRKTIPPSRF
jgi:hypothetical protein